MIMDSKDENRKKKSAVSIIVISKAITWLKRAKKVVLFRRNKGEHHVVHKSKRSHSLPTTPYMLDLEDRLKRSYEENSESALTETYINQYRRSLMKYSYKKETFDKF